MVLILEVSFHENLIGRSATNRSVYSSNSLIIELISHQLDNGQIAIESCGRELIVKTCVDVLLTSWKNSCVSASALSVMTHFLSSNFHNKIDNMGL